jgi:hypothetical protein
MSNYDEVDSGDENGYYMESSESETGDSHSDQGGYYSEDECEYDGECDYYYQDYIEDRNREIRKKLHKSGQPRMAFILIGSKSTANEEMHEADELKQANDDAITGDIDNELKIRRWVVHQLAVDEKIVIRAADDFEWVDKMVYDRAKEVIQKQKFPSKSTLFHIRCGIDMAWHRMPSIAPGD